MKKYLVTASALAMLMAGPALAAEQMKEGASTEADVKVIQEGSDTSASTGAGAGAEAAATRQGANQIDSQQLIGRDIENAAGDTLGEVNSVIIGENGNVEAVIVGVGGFLGIGERDVALEWSDVSVSNNGEQIVANVSREQLEQMPDYQFADEQQRGTVFESDFAGTAGEPATEGEQMAESPAAPTAEQGEMKAGTAGGAEETRSSEADVVVKTEESADVKVKESGAGATAEDSTTVGEAQMEQDRTTAAGETQMDQDPTTAAGETQMEQGGEAAETRQQAAEARPMDELGQMSAEQVIGKDVTNLRGEDVGEVEDVVIDKNQAVFAVVSVGGFLGMGDKSVAVPVNELKLGQNNVIMMSETTEQQLESMPAYDETAYEPLDRTQTLDTR